MSKIQTLVSFRLDPEKLKRLEAYRKRLQSEVPAPTSLSRASVAVHLLLLGLDAETKRLSKAKHAR